MVTYPHRLASLHSMLKDNLHLCGAFFVFNRLWLSSFSTSSKERCENNNLSRVGRDMLRSYYRRVRHDSLPLLILLPSTPVYITFSSRSTRQIGRHASSLGHRGSERARERERTMEQKTGKMSAEEKNNGSTSDPCDCRRSPSRLTVVDV